MTAETPTTGRAERFDPTTIEAGWQERWEADGLYRGHDDDPRAKYYFLTMYPYPSGDLHIGHWYADDAAGHRGALRACRATTCSSRWASTPSGCRRRTPRSDHDIHPSEWTLENIERMREPAAAHGRDVRLVARGGHLPTRSTTSGPVVLPAVLQARPGLPAARRRSTGAPTDQTVLAREQVGRRTALRALRHAGHQARPGAVVLPHHRATPTSCWTSTGWTGPSAIKTMQTQLDRPQRGRRGRLRGRRPTASEPIRVFTTRPDTIYGVTFMVLAPEHPLVAALTTPEQPRPRSRRTSTRRGARPRSSAWRPSATKTGVFIGAYAINPLTASACRSGSPTTCWPSYGTGAVMGVPAHDQRDFEFAPKYGLPIRVRDRAAGLGRRASWTRPASQHAALMVNSGPFDGTPQRRGRSRRGHDVRWRSAASGTARRHLPPARLADQPPALLGHADPDHLLPETAARARAGERPAGAAAGGRRVRADRASRR